MCVGERAGRGRALLHTKIPTSYMEYYDKDMLTCWITEAQKHEHDLGSPVQLFMGPGQIVTIEFNKYDF